MNITGLEAIPKVIRHPAALWDLGVETTVFSTVVKLTTDTGLTGYGYVGPNLPPPPRVVTMLETEIQPLVLGRSPYDVEKLVASYLNAFPAKWTLETTTMAVAGVEIACWDLIGKSLGAPLYRLLGGKYRERIETAATLRYKQRTDEAHVAADARAAVDEGYRTLILKEAAPDQAVAYIAAIREAVGSGVQLRVDPNQAWSLPTAKRTIKRLDHYDLECIEQPIFRWDMDGLAQLRRSVSTPIMLDEGATTIYRVLEAVKKEAVDMISFDPVRMGGISHFKKACAIAEAAGIPVVLHWTGDGGIGTAAWLHLAASTPNLSLAHHIGLDDALISEPFSDELPFIEVPEGRGLGITVDEDKLARHSMKGKEGEINARYSEI